MATIGDVAKLAGVSTTLVSRYLNGVKGVSPASKEKIESAIRELNYVPDESARMLVRRRGGAAPTEIEHPREAPAPAIALLCEDTDAVMMSSLYLGAKIALRADETHRAFRIALFAIPAGDDRASDEADTLSYIASVFRGIYAVGGDDALAERLAALSLPVTHLLPTADAQQLYRTAGDYADTLSSIERESGACVLRLCERIDADSKDTVKEAFSFRLTVSEESPTDRNPLGRSLQSHLL